LTPFLQVINIMEPPVTSSSSSSDERPGSVKKGKSCKRSRKAKSGTSSSLAGSSVSAKRGKGTKEDLDQLLKAITAQAAHVRTVKTQQGAGEAWRKQAVMLEIQKLLELKYKYCALSPTPVTDPQLFVEAEVRPPRPYHPFPRHHACALFTTRSVKYIGSLWA
jgi:hypothetical protein